MTRFWHWRLNAMRSTCLALALIAGTISAVAAPARQKPAPDLGTWCMPVLGCYAVTCDLVRWAVATLPQSTINDYRKHATLSQVKAGEACLRK